MDARQSFQGVAAEVTQVHVPEPGRPPQQQQGFAQGTGDYVSETRAAERNTAMINEHRQSPPVQELPQTRVDQRAAEAQARDRAILENDQTKEQRIQELAKERGLQQLTTEAKQPEKAESEQATEKQKAIQEAAQKLATQTMTKDQQREQER